MTNNKIIILHIEAEKFNLKINSSMTGDDIYELIRTHLSFDLQGNDFAIWDTDRNEKATLHYNELKEWRVYTILPTYGGTQHARPLVGKALKIVTNLAYVRQHWNLSTNVDIFPPDMAPRAPGIEQELQNPLEWSRSFTEKLRMLSVQSQGMHARAMDFVRAEMNTRKEGMEDAVQHATSADLVNAARRFGAQQTDDMADMDGRDGTGWEYAQGGQFNIPSHIRGGDC